MPTTEIVIKVNDQTARGLDQINRKAEAIVQLMDKGFNSTQAQKIAASWDLAAQKAEVFKNTFGRTTAEVEKGIDNANAAVQGLAYEFGVHLPQSVSKFLAQSSAIAPALNAAFSTIAVIGLIQVLSQIPAIFDKISGAISGWSETAQKAYAAFLEDNKKAIAAADDFAAKIAGIAGGPKAEVAERIRRQTAENQQIAERIQGLQSQTSARPDESNFAASRRIKAVQADIDAQQQLFIEGGKKLIALQLQQKEVEAQIDKDAADEKVKQAKKLAEQLIQARLEFEEIVRRLGYLDPFGKDLPDIQGRTGLRPAGAPTIGDIFDPTAGIDFSGILKRGQESSDYMKSVMVQVNEELANGQIAASKRLMDEQRKRSLDMVNSIRDSAGHIFDDMFQRGQSVLQNLANMARGLFNTIGRTAFQSIAQIALVGSRGNGGLLGSAPGLSRLLGFGAAASPFLAGGVSLGATTVAGGSSIASAAFPGLAIANPGIGAGIGTGGGLGTGGLFGLSAGATAGIGAAIVGGGFLLYELFKHRTQEASFTRDPFGNGSQTRLIEFYAANQTRLAHAIETFNRKFNAASARSVITAGMGDAFSDNQFRRQMGGMLTDDAL